MLNRNGNQLRYCFFHRRNLPLYLMFSCQTFGVQIPFPKITTGVIHISKKKYPPELPNPTPFFHHDPHLVANCMKICDTKNASDPDLKKQQF
jgi:hypothetical protein